MTTFKKARLTLAGKIELYRLAYNSSLSTNKPARYYYKHYKKLLLQEALEKSTDLGKYVVCELADGTEKYNIVVSRR